MIELLQLGVVDSTNAWLRSHRPASPLAVMAAEQTAGRGQRGNVWLAEPDQNLLFSLYYLPEALPSPLQFALSEAVALAVVRLLDDYQIRAKIKWPNDIYVGNSKICGILIENGVTQMVENSIIGIGLNVNQTTFPAVLPNPCSMAQLTGRTAAPESVARRLLTHLETLLPLASEAEGREALHTAFLDTLWRRDGQPHPFRDTATGTCFNAVIAGVSPRGFLLLDKADGSPILSYAFKEVAFTGI